MISAISSPMRFEVVDGVFFVTCHNIVMKENEALLESYHQGYGNSWREAKKRFWETWRADHPRVFLTPRIDGEYRKFTVQFGKGK